MSASTQRNTNLAVFIKLAAIVTAVFSVATFFGQLHRLVEQFSHFRMQYLAIALILAVLLVLLRYRSWALFMFAIVIINTLPVAPWYMGPGASGESGFKILHANVYADNDDARRLIELIAAEQPDLVFLQEINERWVADLAGLSAGYPFRHVEARADKFGIAVFARKPPVNVDTIVTPPNGYPSLRLTMNVAGNPLTVMSTHATSPIGRARIDARNAQLASIGAQLAGIVGPRILIGDLNTSMWSHQHALLVSTTGLRNARRGFGVLPTWPAQLPIAMIPIDHCLVSEEISVLELKTGTRIGSDHLPLIVTLALP